MRRVYLVRAVEESWASSLRGLYTGRPASTGQRTMAAPRPGRMTLCRRLGARANGQRWSGGSLYTSARGARQARRLLAARGSRGPLEPLVGPLGPRVGHLGPPFPRHGVLSINRGCLHTVHPFATGHLHSGGHADTGALGPRPPRHMAPRLRRRTQGGWHWWPCLCMVLSWSGVPSLRCLSPALHTLTSPCSRRLVVPLPCKAHCPTAQGTHYALFASSASASLLGSRSAGRAKTGRRPPCLCQAQHAVPRGPGRQMMCISGLLALMP